MNLSVKERIFVLDIGDLFLKFALCEKEGNKLRTVLWGMEELNIVFWHRPLEHVWKLIQESYVSSPVVICFSPTFMKARLGTYGYTRGTPAAAVSEKEFDFIGKELKEYVRNSFSREIASNLGVLENDLNPIDVRVLNWNMDGYSVKDPRGLHGKQLKAEFLTTFLFKTYGQIVEAIAKHHQLPSPFICTGAEAVLRFALEKNQEGIFLDMGDHATQIVVIKKGKLVGVAELAYGGDNFTQLLIQKIGMKTSSAREFKEQYAKRILSEELTGKLKTFFLPEVKNFVRVLKEKLQRFDVLLPNAMFLYGGGMSLKEIKEEIEADGMQGVSFAGELRVSPLTPKDLWDISNMNQLSNPQYTPLFLALYAFSQQPTS